MNNMQITSSQYFSNTLSNEVSSIRATIDGQEMFIPLDPANRHYAEIIRQVEAGTLVIQEADRVFETNWEDVICMLFMGYNSAS